MGNFRLAAAQAPVDLDGLRARLDWLEAQLPEIKSQGADLVLLPELFACGYAIGAALEQSAEPRGGETAQALAFLSRGFSIAIHCGYAERDGGRLYNSAICFGPDGQELSHQRKLAIPLGFERDHFSEGQGCHLFFYKGFRIATYASGCPALTAGRSAC